MFRSLLAAGLFATTAAGAQPAPPPPSSAEIDYRDDAKWLCRPGRADVCSAPYSVASVAPDGSLTVSALPAPKAAKVDCFYVYPTVSTDPGGNSDMTADDAERNVARIQFAPFREVCRTFAPLYRQVTLAALGAVMTGQQSTGDFLLASADVATAWADYLKRDNGGRGVILIGQSQGATLLKSLIRQQIEGKPVAARIVAAYLAGTNIAVPEGKDVGGDFNAIPLCRSAVQTGCIAAWVSFRDEAPPPADTRFGRSTSRGTTVACTNPAAPGGGRGTLQPLLPNGGSVVATAAPQPAWAKGATITSDFIRLPGLLSAECRSSGGASYLAVRTDADPADLRTDAIGGDVVAAGRVFTQWGLHLIDINEATGNLTGLAASQSVAWLKAK